MDKGQLNNNKIFYFDKHKSNEVSQIQRSSKSIRKSTETNKRKRNRELKMKYMSEG